MLWPCIKGETWNETIRKDNKDNQSGANKQAYGMQILSGDKESQFASKHY